MCIFGQLLFGHVYRNTVTANRPSIIGNRSHLSFHPNGSFILRDPAEVKNAPFCLGKNLFKLAPDTFSICLVYKLEAEVRSR